MKSVLYDFNLNVQYFVNRAREKKLHSLEYSSRMWNTVAESALVSSSGEHITKTGRVNEPSCILCVLRLCIECSPQESSCWKLKGVNYNCLQDCSYGYYIYSSNKFDETKLNMTVRIVVNVNNVLVEWVKWCIDEVSCCIIRTFYHILESCGVFTLECCRLTGFCYYFYYHHARHHQSPPPRYDYHQPGTKKSVRHMQHCTCQPLILNIISV